MSTLAVRSLSLALVTLAAFAPVARAGDEDVAAKVDAFVTAEMARERVPGLALAVVKDGRVVVSKGYGLANVELNVPVTPETVFQSGSVGKQFTAAAVMTLVEEGKVGLDDPLTKYFPNAPEAWRAITIRNLLGHTGGTNDYPESFDFRRDYTEDDLMKIVESLPPAFAPGTKWSYSNLGYLTLGVVVRKVTGEFYGDVLRERIFEPLGMKTARIISEADIVPNRAAGYRLVKGELKNQEWVSPTLNTTADGALYLTLDDMVKWDAALSAGKLLKKSSYDAMWTAGTLKDGSSTGYGFGWFVGASHGRRFVEHGGAWQGFKAFVLRYPEDRFSVILFANLADANPGTFAHGVAAVFDPAYAAMSGE